MPSFKNSLCRTPGGFLTLLDFTGADIVTGAYATSVVQFLLMWVLVAVLPALLYWQYRRHRWWAMGAGSAAFILAVDHLMLTDRGSLWQTLAATMILCGPSYLVLAAFRTVLYKIERAVSGRGDAALSWYYRAALVALGVVTHLFFFIAATIADVAGAAPLRVVGDVVNCLYHLSRPVDFRTHGDQLNMLLAALPTLVLVTLLHGCLRRRRMVTSSAPLLLLR